MFEKHSNRQRYYYKKSYLERRLQYDVMENGVAHIPCKVKSIDDIISKFSVKGCESLDTEFLMYIMDFAGFIPPEHMIVLELIGPGFSPEEQKTIIETITAETAYILGRTEEHLNYRRKGFISMIAGTIISGIALYVAKKLIVDVPLEFIFVVFWLFADALVRYMFIDKRDYKEEKIFMGRLASMEVVFKEQDSVPE
ncbi:MAG: hypothetical protein K6G42_03555 [Lachnospiraceae bacterium]|nr:hypothetical protein [Lachnospiraceae bacterium]